jgi:hypothetical protein
MGWLPFLILGAVGLGALWLGRRSLRVFARGLRGLAVLRRGRGRALDDLSLGAVGVRGRVVAIDRLSGPHTGREGVYVQHTVEAWDTTPNIMGAAGKWVCIEHGEEATPFEVTDGETAMLVDPHGAEVLADAVSGNHAQASPPLRYTEALLPADAEVVVLGEVTDQGGFAPAGYRGSPFRRVIAAGKSGLVVSTPARLRRYLAVRLLFGGAGLLGAAVALGLVGLVAANLLPVMQIELPGEVVSDRPPPERYTDSFWRGRTADAVSAGPAAVEAWVLGWVINAKPEYALDDRLKRELWRRQLNGLSDTRMTRRRAWLLFDVVRVEGTAFRRPAFWKAFCRLHPKHCAR